MKYAIEADVHPGLDQCHYQHSPNELGKHRDSLMSANGPYSRYLHINRVSEHTSDSSEAIHLKTAEFHQSAYQWDLLSPLPNKTVKYIDDKVFGVRCKMGTSLIVLRLYLPTFHAKCTRPVM
jgi:hypothetical protein